MFYIELEHVEYLYVDFSSGYVDKYNWSSTQLRYARKWLKNVEYCSFIPEVGWLIV